MPNSGIPRATQASEKANARSTRRTSSGSGPEPAAAPKLGGCTLAGAPVTTTPPPAPDAARSHVAAGAAEPFNYGNVASIPRVTGSPSRPQKSSGQRPFGTTSAVTP